MNTIPSQSFTRRDFMAKAAAFGVAIPLANSLMSTTSLAAQGGDIEAVLATAVAQNDMPFVVAMTGNAAGVTWSGAAGVRLPGVAAPEDTVFRIFSMTKAIGTTAAMQLIEKGKLSVDTPVEEILPQFADMRVLEGFDGDTPKLRAPKTKATIRHLATHTSGLV